MSRKDESVDEKGPISYLREPPKRFLFDGCKLFYYESKLQDFLSGKRLTPVTVDMGIHKGCNMRCTFCYGTYQKPSKDYIPTVKLLEVADDAAWLGIKGIAIIGDGEPTLNPGLYPFVEALTARGVESAVATNGLLLDDEKTCILTRNCTWLRFNISAVGEKYAKIHKGVPKGSFEKLKKTIQHAVTYRDRCTIGLQMVLVPEAFDQVVPLAKLGVELGVDYVQVKQFSDAGTGMPMHFDMNRYDEITESLKEAEALENDTTKIIIKWHALEESKKITMEKKWSFDRCVDLPFLFQISGNGKCYPCGYMFNKEPYCYGDLMEQSLFQILNSDHYWNVVDKVADTPLDKLCNGQCRHSCSNEFMGKFLKVCNKGAKDALIKMAGSKEQYTRLKRNPPEHLSFI